MQTGIIMLIGLLAKTAILLTEYAAQCRKGGASLKEAAVVSAKDTFPSDSNDCTDHDFRTYSADVFKRGGCLWKLLPFIDSSRRHADRYVGITFPCATAIYGISEYSGKGVLRKIGV